MMHENPDNIHKAIQYNERAAMGLIELENSMIRNTWVKIWGQREQTLKTQNLYPDTRRDEHGKLKNDKYIVAARKGLERKNVQKYDHFKYRGHCYQQAR